MSATNLVDLAGASFLAPSIGPAVGVGGTPASGVIVGMICDLKDANNMTTLAALAGPSVSGQFRLQVQTSDQTTSGSFTDPTSGLQVMPTNFLSGGILAVNSGNGLSSGGLFFGSFMRPHRYARAIVMSGDQHNAPVGAAFIGMPKRTGSGAGSTFSPGSGVVSV